MLLVGEEGQEEGGDVDDEALLVDSGEGEGDYLGEFQVLIFHVCIILIRHCLFRVYLPVESKLLLII